VASSDFDRTVHANRILIDRSTLIFGRKLPKTSPNFPKLFEFYFNHVSKERFAHGVCFTLRDLEDTIGWLFAFAGLLLARCLLLLACYWLAVCVA
jgi:hypothetical protein